MPTENLVTGIEEAICVCVVGWMGVNCETVDQCAPYDCHGRGECVMHLGTTPRCVCDDISVTSSAGDNLDCDVETCDDGLTCQNGGRCSYV